MHGYTVDELRALNQMDLDAPEVAEGTPANIRRIAAEHHIAVFEAPQLARALYASTDLDREIPSGLYMAVAQVLSYVFRIKTMNPTLAARLARPEPKLGDEFKDV